MFDAICDLDNLKEAHKAASRGKSHYSLVKHVNENLDECLLNIQKMLKDGTFTTSEYEVEECIKGGKHRVIHKLPYYPNRIIQHALIRQCSDVWDKSFIRDTFQSIPVRGGLDCFRRVNRFVKLNKMKYCLKIDIVKFYPSVKNKYLLEEHVFRVKCHKTFSLIKGIVESCPELPIGNHLSQYAGNLILNRLDWYCKQDLKIRGYFRYCDDIVIFSDCKDELLMWRDLIGEKLSEIELVIKGNSSVVDLSLGESLDFVGFRIYLDKVKVRKRIVDNFKKACESKSKRSIPSYYGWFKHSNCKNLFYKNTRGLKWKHSAQKN